MASHPSASVRVVAHDVIGSTNADALERARAGERGPLWITARRQSAGRGRRGRTWISDPGNLYATLLLTDPGPPDRAAELSFVSALAVHDAVAGQFPGLARRLALKWPNDGLIDERKFAGILIEGEGAAVAVGIGINCTHHPSDTRTPATDLATAGAPITPDRLFVALSAAMDARLAQWNRGDGFAVIRAEWLARAANVGRLIRVAVTGGEHEGWFEGLDQSGRLLLRLAEGRTETVTAGEVLAARVGAR